MKEKIRIIKEFLKFYFTSKTKYSVHSPWVYNLLTEVILENKENRSFDKYLEIEEIRKTIIRNSQKISLQTPGVRAKTVHKTLGAKIKSISQPKAGARVLSRLTEFCSPKTIIELGTAAGIATMYISVSSPQADIFTVEGDELMAEVAAKNFKVFKNKNIKLIKGRFSDVLPELLQKIDKLDLAFIDGDHGREATINYYELLSSKIHSKSLIIFHDIYWSDEMKEAWREIIAKSEVIISIDCFYFGLLFFDSKMKKQDFKLR